MEKFNEFPKMARLSREIIISEKIDGTNASIFINQEVLEEDVNDSCILLIENGLTLRAGSRTKWIKPNDDNYGFAKWVQKNGSQLLTLGEGHHFGEWWGNGIQRGYGLKEKRFSLFNIMRWADERPECCHVIPELWRGEFRTPAIELTLEKLIETGSIAAPGFMKPEGIVVWHTAGNFGLKKTIEKDEVPKSFYEKTH